MNQKYQNRNISSFLGRESSRMSVTSYECERGVNKEKFKNADRATECAMTCVGKEDKNTLTRKELSALVPQYLSNFFHKKSAFTLAEGATHVAHWKDSRKVAFTLAEVLITLGIIGVVAALMLPTVIANYQKQRTVSYVKKFYNEINNAIRLAAADSGDVESWMPEKKNNYYQDNLDFTKTYILPYMKYDHYDNCAESRVCVYLSYGMFTFRVDKNGADIAYFINSKREISPRNYFLFQFNKVNFSNNYLGDRPIVEPYIFAWNGDYKNLKGTNRFGCNEKASEAYVFCTKLLQMNDWKITDDYPWNGKPRN